MGSISNTSNIVNSELKIPTSFGSIAAKVWGTPGEDKLRVLAVHGWSDNAGTFDRLFRLLPSVGRMYIVAIDLPGHGSSTHLPPGLPYTDLTWVVEIKRVLDYLDWKEGVTFISHSMGANASLELAAVYPDVVENLVMLDTIKPRVFPNERLAEEAAFSISVFETLIRSPAAKRPKLSFDVSKAVKIIIDTHGNGDLTPEGAECLFPRAVDFVYVNGRRQFSFKRDIRLNAMVYRKFSVDMLLTYLADLRCRLLILRAKSTHHTLRCPHERPFLDQYSLKCKEFTYREVDGDHYVHLTNPENVVDYIEKFLEPAFAKLPQK